MKKRIFSALMALCLAFSISGAAFADDATAGAPQTAAYTADANGAGSAGDGTGSAEGSSSSESTGSESSSPDSTPSSSEESKEEAVSSSSSSSESSSGSESSSASSGSEVTSDSASSDVSSDSTIPESGSSSSTSQGESVPADEEMDDEQGEGASAPASSDGSSEEVSPANNALGNEDVSTFDLTVDGDTAIDSNRYKTRWGGWDTYNYPLIRGEDTSKDITINVFDYDEAEINYNSNVTQRPFRFSDNPNGDNPGDPVNGYPTGQGIVNNTLTDGYPTLASGRGSLDYLFNEDQVSGKTSYLNANYLFQLEDGYYYYDSDRNFATLALEENSNNFWLYKDHAADSNIQPKFMPFNSLDKEGGYEWFQYYLRDELAETTDYHFGMTIDFDFLMPLNGQVEGQDMTFEFSGDDDVWVFIDNQLVLDIGGIHGDKGGSINFANGEVKVDDAETQYIWNLYGMSEAQWRDAWTYKEHNLRFFYLERGAGGSNCMIKFNMPTIPKNSVAVSKRVTGDTEDTQYTLKFVAAEGTDLSGVTVSDTPNGEGNSLNDGTFTIREDQTKYINNIPAGTQYTIQEIGVPESVTSVSIDGVTATISEDRTASITNNFSSDEKQSVVVTNAYPIAPPEDFEGLNVFKTAVEHPDDENLYDLTLSVTGDTGSVNNQTKLDVLFILDTSGSMKEVDVPSGRNTISRRSAANDAIRTLVTDLENNKALDIQYGLITFSGSKNDGQYNDAKNMLNQNYWTSTASDIIGTQYGENWYGGVLPSSSNGGTNYEAGFVEAAKVLEQKREDAKTVVIFISDGMPGYYYAGQGGEFYDHNWYIEGSTIGDGSPNKYDSTGQAIQRAITACKALDMDYFYTVGVAEASSLDALDDLVESGAPTLIEGATKDSYMATSMEDLRNAFKNIQNNITSFACSHVVMHDTLSENVAALSTDTQFRVYIEKKNNWGDYVPVSGMNQTVTSGSSAFFTVEGESFTITPQLAADGKTITVTFTENYQLEPGYRYSVEVVISPSDTAKNQYQNADWENGTGLDTADADTGTYEEQKGLYSNDNSKAYVSYQIDSTQDGVAPISDSVFFPKPVIRVPAPSTGDLTITKNVQASEGVTLDASNATFEFTITTDVNVTLGEPGYTITGDGATGASPKAQFSSVEGQEGTYQATVTITGAESITIEGLPIGTYTVTETNASDIASVIGDYYCDLPQAGSDEIKADDLDASVTITNTYKPYKTLIIEKVVDGGMGVQSDLFKFTATVTRNGEESGTAVTEDTAKQLNAELSNTGFDPVTAQWFTEDNVSGFKLANGGQLKITKLKDGDKVTFVETDAGQNGYKTNYTIGEGDSVHTLLKDTAAADYAVTIGEKVTVANAQEDDGKEEIEIPMTDNEIKLTVTNTRDVVAPTGLESNHTAPYALMVTAAGVAGLALLGSMAARRRRRQE